jgi:hypothetical protein
MFGFGIVMVDDAGKPPYVKEVPAGNIVSVLLFVVRVV